MEFRVGLGYDSHRLSPNIDNQDKPFLLAGIVIPYGKHCIAHSDGDALMHALCDALLGAASLKDIGTHFPDTDPAFFNVNSAFLLSEVKTKLSDNKWIINNIDITVLLEKPKLSPFIDDMVFNLADILKIETHKISIKAKTNEKLDAVGNEEAVVVYAIVSIVK